MFDEPFLLVLMAEEGYDFSRYPFEEEHHDHPA
jgi:hypothetical protein